MGKTSSRGPNTKKNEENGSCKYLRYGLCEMQGWRSKMEDASLAAVDFNSNTSLFGVMDGHGGSLISNFVASNFERLLKHMKAYKQKKYEQALIETFLKFDELLRIEKIDNFLKENANTTKKDGKLVVNFEKSGENQLEEEDARADLRHDDDENISADKRLRQWKGDESSKTDERDETNTEGIPSQLISHSRSSSSKRLDIVRIDSNIREKYISNSNFNSGFNSNNNSRPDTKINSPTTMKTPEDSRSNDSIILNGNKILISRKTDSNEYIITKNYDALISNNMGTTANIILIKNNQIFLANVGDSLAVLFKNGQAIRLNDEHKVTLPSESTRINKSGAKVINNRIEGRLNLTRAIGDMSFKKNYNLKFFEQAVTAYPQITNHKISNDCEFIIMGCDGVWDCVDVQKLCEFVSTKLKNKVKISQIISEIFDKIISTTNNTPVGTDNMTCIIIEFIHQ